MAKWEHNLPAVLNPVGDICVKVTIPAHPDYVKLFVRAIRQLEVNRMYQRDEELSAKIVVEQWRNRTVTPLIEALATGTGLCDGLDGECLAYPPFASFISYSPQNPYTEPDLVPDGYTQPPFYVNGKDNAHTLPNYERGDVIVDFGSISFDTGFGLENSPQIQLCLEGSGVVELKLLSIVQGGVVVVTVDNPPDILDIIGGVINEDLLIVDTNQDIVSIPPETAIEIIQEVEIETEGEHIVYITFLPIIDDSLIPLRFGGGLRSVSLCGNLRPCGMPEEPPPPPLEGVTELRPEFQFTADCGMEYRLRDQNNEIVQDWTPVQGWSDNADLCFGVGGGMATVEEICEGVSCAIEKAAVAIIQGYKAGAINDVNIGYDGSTTVTPPGQAPDDTTTSSDEEERAGGATGVRNGYQTLVKQLDTFITQGLTAAVMAVYLEEFFEFDDVATLEATIQIYVNWRATPNAAYTIPSSMAEKVYCRGLNKQVLNTWAFNSTNATLDDFFIQMTNALSMNQFNYWFNQGKLVPSTDYVEYACTKFDTETIEFKQADGDFAGGAYKTGSVVNKNNHRVLLEASGKIIDTVNGGYQDFFWKVAADGTKTLIGTATSGGTAQVTSNWSWPTAAEVPFRSDGIYKVTRETVASGATFLSIRRKMGSPEVGGQFTLKITDLGEIIT